LVSFAGFIIAANRSGGGGRGGVMVGLVAEGGQGAVVATGSPQAMGRVRGRNQTRFEGRRRLRRKVVAMEEGRRHRRGSQHIRP
jgi:hypothetical protein